MKIKSIASILVLMAGLTGLAFGQQGQAALTSTTLSSAISNTSTSLCLASVTGLAAPVLPGTPVSEIYIDREALGVYSVNTTSNCITVSRGYLGTRATHHATGQMVLISNQYQTTLAQGGNPSPNGFDDHDPSLGASCTSAPGGSTAGTTLPATYPLVNVLTGAQWLCSTITNTWVPGFNNPLVANAAGPTTAVASVAGSTLPSGPLFHVTGTNAITGWTAPVGCNATAVGACSFTVIPDAVFTWTSAGNIGLAGTAVVNKALTFIWDAKNSKWIPSYIA
jgi:hypothetical protein